MSGNFLMRTALASLLAATAFVSVAPMSVAWAQTPSAQPAQPSAPAPATATPQPPAPPATTPGTTVPPTTGATGTGPTAAPPTTTTPDATAPAAPAAPAEAPPPPPSLPTSGDGATILQVLEKICVPLVRGGNLDEIAKANASTMGLKKNRRDNTWQMPLNATSKDYNITFAPSGVNKDVCRAEVHYAVGEDKPIVSAINIWAFLHQPELILQANYVAVDPDGIKRVRKSWEHLEANASTAVNFSTWTKPDDSSLNAKFSTGELYYQERKF
jgi:hypothetical protein